jgi:hypothetical protein
VHKRETTVRPYVIIWRGPHYGLWTAKVSTYGGTGFHVVVVSAVFLVFKLTRK